MTRSCNWRMTMDSTQAGSQSDCARFAHRACGRKAIARTGRPAAFDLDRQRDHRLRPRGGSCSRRPGFPAPARSGRRACDGSRSASTAETMLAVSMPTALMRRLLDQPFGRGWFESGKCSWDGLRTPLGRAEVCRGVRHTPRVTRADQHDALRVHAPVRPFPGFKSRTPTW
jgi:hypothetical protein